jgi:hypothetical protein
MRKLFLLMLTMAVVTVSSCGDPAAPEPTMAGTWTGSGGGISVNLSLTQAEHSVSGNGSMSGGSGALALTATGSFTNPNFSLTISAPGYEDMNFAGTLAGNSATGVINGSGFNQVGMTLTRK